MSKIFFSYSRKDSEFVDQLIEKLESYGVEVWVDRGDILAGIATWRQQIVEAIMDCQVFVIVLSPNSIASDNVTKELTLAEQHAKRVLPLVIKEVKIPPSLDYQLAGLHYQTFAEGSYEDNFERLARSLGALGVTLKPKDDPIIEEALLSAISESEPLPTIQSDEEPSVPETQITEPPDEIVTTATLAAVEEATVNVQKTEPLPSKVNEQLIPVKTEIERPVVTTQQLIPDPAPPAPIPKISDDKLNPFQKIPIWLWAAGGFVVLVGIIIVFMSFLEGNKQVANPTATEAITLLQPSETAELTPPPPTDTIVQVLSTETAALLPTTTPFPPKIFDSLGIPMVFVPASPFRMGTSQTDALAECQSVNPSLNCGGFYFGDEEPERTVSLDYDYYIDQYEVTNERYDACVVAGECDPPWNFNLIPSTQYYRIAKYNQYPVVNVTWDAANVYCEWRGGRLPTEAEWEKAARGTVDSRLYPWGDNLDENKANFCDANCGNSWANRAFNDGYDLTAPVGEFSSGASLYGVEDMAGNVSEWVTDLYGPYPGGEADVDSQNFGKERIRRGGSWYSLGSDTRVSRRDKNLPAPHLEDPTSELGKIGFRCVMDIPLP